MRTLPRIFRILLAVLVLASVLTGCSTISSILNPRNLIGNVAENAAETGVKAALGDEEAKKQIETLSKPEEEINPEDEYYLGRAVGAQLLSTYPAYRDQTVNGYLNTVGQSLAIASEMPETYRGYHFSAMDSAEINAFAAPSGFIFATRGLLRCATSEDEVAAVLAHEISHVTGKHGLKAIQKSRQADRGALIAKWALSGSDSSLLGKMVANFGASVSDMVKTMVTAGYSRDLEKEADLGAVRLLHRVGYDPRALVRVLQAMKPKLTPGGKDFAKTHPDPGERILYIEEAIRGLPPLPSAAAVAASAAIPKRQARFKSALGKL